MPERVGVGHEILAVRERVVAGLRAQKKCVGWHRWVDARKEAALASGAQLGLQRIARQALASTRRRDGRPLARGVNGGRQNGLGLHVARRGCNKEKRAGGRGRGGGAPADYSPLDRPSFFKDVMSDNERH